MFFMKNYDKWNLIKKNLNNNDDVRPYYFEREVWYCYIGENIGFEEDGKGDSYLRPVLVVKKFNKEIFWGVPLTSSNKKSEFYYQITIKDRISSILISQLRLIDAKRLSYRISIISRDNFSLIKERIRKFLS